ncbi:MAG: hypothetical protein JXD22_13090 [Sedimentisphaerales bacterium]|nr:hypothetical protein [Sedimentisphaerales bacterium]
MESTNKKSNIGQWGFALSIIGIFICYLTTIPGLICSIIGIKRKNHLVYSWMGFVVACLSVIIIIRHYTFTGINIDLPDGSGHIVFLRKSIHPFLAEYDRNIKFKTNNIADITKPLPVNVGGKTKINVYWYAKEDGHGPFLRLQDHWGEYLIDLERGQIFEMLRTDKRVFIGNVRDNRGAEMGWESFNGKITRVYSGNQDAEEITGKPHSRPGIYIGRIDGTKIGPCRFIRTDDSSEELIE